jgi:DnaJ-class molecular chaperone
MEGDFSTLVMDHKERTLPKDEGYPVLGICAKCKGKGGKESAARSYHTCSGRGIKVTLRQMVPGSKATN